MISCFVRGLDFLAFVVEGFGFIKWCMGDWLKCGGVELLVDMI